MNALQGLQVSGARTAGTARFPTRRGPASSPDPIDCFERAYGGCLDCVDPRTGIATGVIHVHGGGIVPCACTGLGES